MFILVDNYMKFNQVTDFTSLLQIKIKRLCSDIIYKDCVLNFWLSQDNAHGLITLVCCIFTKKVCLMVYIFSFIAVVSLCFAKLWWKHICFQVATKLRKISSLKQCHSPDCLCIYELIRAMSDVYIQFIT